MRFECQKASDVVVRFVAVNTAITGFELLQINPGGVRVPLGNDPDFDGRAAFALNPPAPGEIPGRDLAVEVKTAVVAGGQVPVRISVEQGGVRLQPIDPPATPATTDGFLLGQVDSGGFGHFRFRLLFVL